MILLAADPTKAERTRARVLAVVVAEPCCTTAEVAEELRISRPCASMHLAALRMQERVRCRMDAKARIRVWWAT